MKRIIAIVASLLFVMQVLYAQERRIELGGNAAFGFSHGQSIGNKYGFELFAGYKLNNNFSSGIGINYSYYWGRNDLPSGIEKVCITTDGYHSIAPFIYGHYGFNPYGVLTPYIEAHIGYGFFSDTMISYQVSLLNTNTGFAYTDEFSEYEFLKTLDHTLSVKGNVYSSINLGVTIDLGGKRSKLMCGFIIDIQNVDYYYNNRTQNRLYITVGPQIGYWFN